MSPDAIHMKIPRSDPTRTTSKMETQIKMIIFFCNLQKTTVATVSKSKAANNLAVLGMH
jgi:hypothetical protein